MMKKLTVVFGTIETINSLRKTESNTQFENDEIQVKEVNAQLDKRKDYIN